MKKIQQAVAAVLAAVMMLALAACGTSDKTAKDSPAPSVSSSSATASASSEPANNGEKVKLRIYTGYSADDEKIPFDYAKKALEEEMPNVELELDIQAQDDNMKLKTYAASGNLPDIFSANTDVINVFRKSNNILQLDEYVNQFDFESKLLPSSKNLLYADDQHIYGFPVSGNDLVLLYYNKELFEKYGVKVPTTFDELIAAAKVFNSNGIVPLSLFGKEKWITMALFDLIATRYDTGGVKKLDELKGKASDEAYAHAAAKMDELVKAGLLSKSAPLMNYDQAAGLFYEGKAAMFLNGSWEITESTKKMGDKVDYMYYPSQDAASYEKNKFALSGSNSYGGFAVNPKTKDKELAAKVAAFMALKIAEGKVTLRGNPIVATKVTKAPENPLAPMFTRLNGELSNITSTTAFSWSLSNAKIKVALEDETQKLVAGGAAADFVKNIDKAIEVVEKEAK
ncbi:extracellular solute-binding protein [Paenibacillus sp. LHD-117]|uniref:ABC transporter substrate-binding protein n=1 Tax=Paenibacillus sp. LHD-117 TaxID=3071412 RepID=UPI0027E0E600|nr:extracellular solute-binding protein [Paenibacillus sp. LHD-117]MDQ6420502.1 extracellular solute-binding protein [Paenibacillus sp. LHD-117]